MTRRRRDGRATPGAWGTVEQLPSGRWRAFYRADGHRFSAPHTFATKDDAHGWLAMERADRTRGTWRDPRAGQVTLRGFAEAWMESRPDLAPRTRDTYRRLLERWVLPSLGGRRGVELGRMLVAELTPSVIRSWYAAVFATARDRASELLTRNAERRAHPARAWARARGISIASTGQLPQAVLAAWRAAGEPRGIERPVPAPLDAGKTTAAQAYRLLHAMLATAVQDRMLLFALARRHVDLEAGTLRVERALLCVPGQPIEFGPTKTAKSRRVVHLPAFVLERLAAHLDEHTAADPDALVFTMRGGEPVSNVRLSFAFRRARAVIGREELTWHDLRHTGATLAYKAGASLPEVQARLGHTTMRAASIYAHAADDSDRVLADRLDSIYGAREGQPKLRAV